ncbi:MAG: hypothetical protein RIC87_21525, partial [Kiloniellales bacterium]
MSCYANLMIEDAAKAAAMVDDAAEAFDVASFNADPIDQDRLRVAHRCALDQHQALVDLIATSQAQTLKEALTQMQIARNFLDGLAADHDIRAEDCRDLRKLLMIIESVVMVLEDHLEVRRQSFDVYHDGGSTMELRPFMQIEA